MIIIDYENDECVIRHNGANWKYDDAKMHFQSEGFAREQIGIYVQFSKWNDANMKKAELEKIFAEKEERVRR